MVAVPVTVSTPIDEVPMLPVVAKRFVDEAVPVNCVVDVEFVVVELRPVKFCSVDDPLERMLEALIEPLVMLPVLSDVEKRFVDDAVVANCVVEVEFVVVELRPVKFCSVDEPDTSRLPAVSRDVMKPLVALRVEEKKLVEVDCEVVALTAVKFWSVVEPETRRSPEELIEVVAV